MHSRPIAIGLAENEQIGEMTANSAFLVEVVYGDVPAVDEQL